MSQSARAIEPFCLLGNEEAEITHGATSQQCPQLNGRCAVFETGLGYFAGRRHASNKTWLGRVWD